MGGGGGLPRRQDPEVEHGKMTRHVGQDEARVENGVHQAGAGEAQLLSYGAPPYVGIHQQDARVGGLSQASGQVDGGGRLPVGDGGGRYGQQPAGGGPAARRRGGAASP